MRNRIFGAIGVVWGFFILRYAWTTGAEPGADEAFRRGQFIGWGVGLLMFLSGLYYLIKGDGPWPWKKTKKRKKGGGPRLRPGPSE